MTRGEPLSPPLEELSVQYCIFALRALHQLQCAVRGPSGQHVYFELEALSSAPRTPMPWSRGGNMNGLLRVPGRLLSPDMRGAPEVQTRPFTASSALPVRFGQACMCLKTGDLSVWNLVAEQCAARHWHLRAYRAPCLIQDASTSSTKLERE